MATIAALSKGINMNIYRAWINQPSTLQVLHILHGRRCIVYDTKDKYITIYFTDGLIHSMIVPRMAISRIHLSSAQ